MSLEPRRNLGPPGGAFDVFIADSMDLRCTGGNVSIRVDECTKHGAMLLPGLEIRTAQFYDPVGLRIRSGGFGIEGQNRGMGQSHAAEVRSLGLQGQAPSVMGRRLSAAIVTFTYTPV